MFSKKIFKKVNYLSTSLAKARRKNILIKPLPINISKNLDLVKQIRGFAMLFLASCFTGRQMINLVF